MEPIVGFQNTATALLRRSFRIGSSNAPWLSLHLHAVLPSEQSPRAVLLLHGATLASFVFDLPVPGYSLQERLAAAGWASYALDVRGYGRSSRPVPGEPGCPSDRPFSTAAECIADVADAVRFLRHDRRHAEIVLVGYSWGTILAGRFVAAYPGAVSRMILFAPIYGTPNARWISQLGVPDAAALSGFGRGGYRWTTADELQARWDSEIPTEEKSLWRANEVLKAVLHAALGSDPLSLTRAPPAFRSPTGCSVDLSRAFSGYAAFDAGKIELPILLVRGDSDTTSTEADVLRLLKCLESRDKHSITIPSGTHFACFEYSAPLLLDALLEFL
jgi:alpha-beta hydrolase superfamily lysophospholipase